MESNENFNYDGTPRCVFSRSILTLWNITSVTLEMVSIIKMFIQNYVSHHTVHLFNRSPQLCLLVIFAKGKIL